MKVTDCLGWTSSVVLVVTLVHQVTRQWRTGRSEGVSPWLFVGQLAASIGFLVYSVSLQNWVFTVTNALLVVNAIAGYVITLHQRKRAPAAASRNPGGGALVSLADRPNDACGIPDGDRVGRE